MMKGVNTEQMKHSDFCLKKIYLGDVVHMTWNLERNGGWKKRIIVSRKKEPVFTEQGPCVIIIILMKTLWASDEETESIPYLKLMSSKWWEHDLNSVLSIPF